MTTLREAYDASAGAWSAGPDVIFSALATALLARGPQWEGLSVVDVGAGTGTATRRLAAAGARAVAVDAADEMLSVARAHGASTTLVGDALALPLRAGCTDAVVLGFVLNHLSQPGNALREAVRVVRPGGWVLASTWARDDAHPVREIVQQALLARGWRVPAWYRSLKDTTARLSDTPDALGLLARDAGLTSVDAAQVEVPVRATVRELLEWRLGMPHTAPFVASLPRAEQGRLWQEVEAAVATQPPLVCTVVLLVSRVA